MNQRKTFLIADDSFLNREILQDFFSDQYDIMQAVDGEQAIDILIKEAKNIDLLLLDLKMPKLDGFEVLQYMKAYHLDDQIPVIVITGSTDYKDELQAYNLGALDIIHKPFLPQIVMRRAENVLDLFEHRKNLEKKLDDVQNFDTLTGLYNMQKFLRLSDHRLFEYYNKNTEGQDPAFSVIYFDIKNFKMVNIEEGIAGGNQLLIKVAEILSRHFSTDIVGRFSEDHFVVLSNDENVMAKVETVQTEFFKIVNIKDVVLKAGIYGIDNKDVNIDVACELAKSAIDEIKKKDVHVQVYGEELQRKLALNAYVLRSVDDAIENEWIKVYYQPVVRTLTGSICGFEALARWIDPQYGFLSPVDFIPVLEESGQISKLDQYIIEKVCATLKECDDNHIEMVPVSVNLSRVDIIKLDMVEFIEETCQKYGVARDMVNIEITESVAMTDHTIMKDSINRFISMGYQVWMDDFGSGYSSLNVLKNFRFDEIKLDMAFMRDFNETSKNIVKAMIMMAKNMNIATLTEGVETEEQYEFLKSVGCDRIQGYLISKPIPFEEVLKHRDNKTRPIESRREQKYYDKIGQVDFMTDRNIAIVEYNGEDVDFLFANENFKEEINKVDKDNKEELKGVFGDKKSLFWKKFKLLLGVTEKDKEYHEMDYNFRGYVIRMRNRQISKFQNHMLCLVELISVTKQEQENDNDDVIVAQHILNGMNDTILIGDIKNNTFKEISKSVFNQSRYDKDFNQLDFDKAVDFAVKNYIYKEDIEEYLAFIDKKTLKSRIINSERNYIAKYLRVNTDNGGYVWKVHYIVNIPGTDKYVYMNMFAPLTQEGLFEKVHNVHNTSEISKERTQFWNAMMDSKTVKFFWKDRDRRFLGANKSFLDVYGFSSVDEILGKTDEDMKWHVNDEPFKNDELEVIEEGKCFTNQLGKCTINGISYDILATKEPLYSNGEIVGLWGCFTILQNVVQDNNGLKTLEITDPVTGLLSARGVMPTVFDFVESYHARHEDFAVISIQLPRYRAEVESYGAEFANKVMSAIGKIIRTNVGYKGNSAYLYGGSFVIYMRFYDKNEITDLVENISEDLLTLRKIDETPVTVRPEISTFFASQAKDSQDLLWNSMLVTIFQNIDDFREKHRMLEVVENTLDRIPCAVVVYDVDKDGDFTCSYISESAKNLIANDNPNLKANQEAVFDYIHPDDRDWAESMIEENLKNHIPTDTTYRIVDKHGEVKWIRHVSQPFEEEDGHWRCYAIYHDITLQAKQDEEQKNELAVRYGDYLNRRFDASHVPELLTALNMQDAMMKSLSSLFIAAYIINVQTKSFMKIACQNYIEQVVSQYTDAQEALNKLVDVMVSSESYEETKEFLDISTLEKRLVGKKLLSLDYNGIVTGWCRGQMIPVSYDEDGNLREVLHVAQHIHSEKIEAIQLREMAEQDAFTGLYNRKVGEKKINELLQSGGRGMVALMDVDDFKHFNDIYGHAVGDEVLLAISNQLRMNFHDGEILIRLGGDEFLIYAPKVQSKEEAEEKMNKFSKDVSSIKIADFGETISISAGLVYFEEGEYIAFEQVYKVADVLMYGNKGDKKSNQLNMYREISDEMPVAMLIYRDNEEEEIVFASKGLIKLFDCENYEDFIDYTKGSFKNIVHPDELERVEGEIRHQIRENGDTKLDYVEYNIISSKGKIKKIYDYGHLVNSQEYGSAYFVILTERMDLGKPEN